MSILERIASPAGEIGPDADPDAVDEVAHVLSNARRRRVIEVLVDRLPSSEPGIGIGELAECLAEREYGPGYSSQDRKRLYIGLYQVHLDALDAAGVIEWDPRVDRVTIGERFDDYVVAMDALEGVAEG